jgi:hypothetical protein
LLAVGPIYGIETEMAFANVPYIKNPLLAKGAGFDVPVKHLTERQKKHVREHLVPHSRYYHTGNVSRTRMHVRKSY